MSKTNSTRRHVKGMQITKPERQWLEQCASGAEDLFTKPLIVNIGIAWGASMHCLRDGSKNANLVGVDIDLSRVVGKDILRASFLEGDSGMLGINFPDAIHLLFIDGCHYFGTVLADIMTWGQCVVDGGAMIFHDYSPTAKNLKLYPDLAGVRGAVEFWRNKDWDEMPAPDSLGMFVRKK